VRIGAIGCATAGDARTRPRAVAKAGMRMGTPMSPFLDIGTAKLGS
jgi:hypothetical protein